MKTQYVGKRSEVTALMDESVAQGNEVYRTRMECGCRKHNNRRSGVLVIRDNSLTQKVIRCKACAALYETQT